MKLILLLSAGICTLLPLQAQKTAGKDSLLNREMTLEKKYSPTIEPATKIIRLPELHEPQAPNSKVAFSNYFPACEAQFEPASLLPANTMPADLNASQYAGFISLRLSTVLNFDGDAAWQILNTSRNFLDIYCSRRSSNSKNPSLQIPSGTQKFFMNDNWGGFNYSRSFDSAKLSAGLKYTYSAFNYSGLTVTPQPSPACEIKDHPGQATCMTDAHAGISSDTPNKLNGKINLRYTGFKQKQLTYIPGVKENRLTVDWDMHKAYYSTSGFGLGGFYKTYKYNSEEFWNYPPNNSIMHYSVLSLTPYYYMKDGNLNLTLGLRADFELGGRKKIVLAPNIRFNCHPSNTFAFYASALGGRNDNSKYDMFSENRYVYPLERVRDSRTFLDGTAGLKYLPVSSLSLDVFAGYRLTEDEHFFTPLLYSENEPTGSMITGVSYGTAKVVKLGAQINYALQDLFGINLKGTLYKWDVTGSRHMFDMDGIETEFAVEAYHKPRFEVETDVFFRAPNIPLRINMAFKGLYGRKTIELFHGKSYRMKDAHDLSVKASYAVTPFFSVNLSANNLLFRKYDIWYGYPAQKFNIMGGASMMF